ncbi:putative transcription factor Nin-like family [Helianthus annuus]|uniref:Transcription factor n=1 Tax=Helianthus annuus TaxID=4232 RepID=A0A251TWX2_HELAN|nr:transcription factor MTB1 [Helianthus annuus]KAF5818866.1 putative transcription factor Nin-like family [Helianthus annuus]KAJ0605088.1 putative transcription factor Nin-like family [Helianthus annuus]KAJ0619106.1 putative transcription factor Nin-like family [Helianthus annuus]KAJ0777554.1 putative transcription factor Nin-like family [Helianthus annuus]KAJ0786588.1 putative transcription factor Nin-like family [Helianthus annuus]
MNLLNTGDDPIMLSDMLSTPISSPTFASVDDLLEIFGSSEPYNKYTFQQHLHDLIDNSRQPWTYAIFWQSSSIVDYSNKSVMVLGWGDGYYRGEFRKPKTTSSSVTSFAEQEHRKRVIRELDSMISGSELETDAIDEVTDTEWFFLISMTQSFFNGNGLPSQATLSNQPGWITGQKQVLASRCEHARQGLAFRLQKMVCIPFRRGVVELGSTELIFQSSGVMNQVRVLFDITNTQPDLAPIIADQTARGDTGLSKAKCNTTAISSSQQLVDKQSGNTMKEAAICKTTETSFPQEVVENQSGNYMKEAAKCKTTEILLPLEVVEKQFGKTMKEAAKNLDVSESTLKRKLRKLGIPEWQGPNFVKRKANDSSVCQSNTAKENNGAIQDPSIVNINNSLITIKAEYANDMIKFCLPNSQATFMIVQQEIGKKFKLIIGTYNLKYLDEDGDWICLTSDEEMIHCIESSTKLDRIVVRLRVVPSP